MIGTEIPQAAGLFFPYIIERPTEAPIMSLEKKTCNEELQSIARLASENYKSDCSLTAFGVLKIVNCNSIAIIIVSIAPIKFSHRKLTTSK